MEEQRRENSGGGSCNRLYEAMENIAYALDALLDSHAIAGGERRGGWEEH